MISYTQLENTTSKLTIVQFPTNIRLETHQKHITQALSN